MVEEKTKTKFKLRIYYALVLFILVVLYFQKNNNNASILCNNRLSRIRI